MSDYVAPADQGRVIKLRSSDGNEFLVSRKIIGISEALGDLFNNFDRDITNDNTDPNSQRPLEQSVFDIPAKADVLGKVLEWCEHRVKNPEPIDKLLEDSVMSEWDIEFFDKLDKDFLMDLVKTAEYLDINELASDGMSAYVTVLSGKTQKDRVVENRIITLLSSDDQKFLVRRKICGMSKTLDNLFVNLDLDSAFKSLSIDAQRSMEPLVLDIPAEARILEKVIKWCEHHVHNLPPISLEMKDFVMSEWDSEFFKGLDQPTLMDVIKTANYLEIPLLINGGCRTVANMIRGKSVKELREHFGVVNDFTPEEEEKIRKENEWFEK